MQCFAYLKNGKSDQRGTYIILLPFLCPIRRSYESTFKVIERVSLRRNSIIILNSVWKSGSNTSTLHYIYNSNISTYTANRI